MATTKRKTPTKKRASPIEQLWLKQQFDQLHKEHALILKKIADLGAGPDSLVIPALESQVRKALALAIRIDEQVPD